MEPGQSQTTFPTKIDDGDYSLGWIGHPDAIDSASSANDKYLSAHRSECIVWGMVSGDDACYSYDDWALVELEGKFFLINTAGCSCPSPTETWHVACEPGSLQSQWDHLTTGDYSGWSVPGRQMEDFRKMFAFVGESKGIDLDLSFVSEGGK